MRTRRNATIEDLRRAIGCLPIQTRVAMLDGIRSNPIIVGAYAREDGICPMLAAHRAGGRTSLIAFARAWDRFAYRGARRHTPRRATERELLVLRTHLEASLLEEGLPTAESPAAESSAAELGRAIAEHRALVARSARPDELSRALAAAEASLHQAQWRKLIGRRQRRRELALRQPDRQ